MERRSLLPLFREFIIATLWFATNVVINLQIGFGWSFMWTGIAGVLIGWWRGDKGSLSILGLWLFFNLWYFIYVLQAFQLNGIIGWFVLASYGGSLLGLILSQFKEKLSTSLTLIILLFLSILIILVGLQLPLDPPDMWMEGTISPSS